MAKRLSVLVLLLAVAGSVTAARGNEVCKSALAKHPAEGTPAAARKKVLDACAGGHGRNTPLLKKLLKRCDGLFGGKAPAEVVEGCKVDAYRYISWDEYP